MNLEAETIEVEKDVFEFLKRCCYTATEKFLGKDYDDRLTDELKMAIATAYRDLCRTLWADGKDNENDAKRDKLSQNARSFIEKAARDLVDKE